MTEYDCFAKAFFYLSSRLTRSEFMEPFIDEATVEPIRCMVEGLSFMSKMSEDNMSQALKLDVEAFKQGMEAAKGAPSAEAVRSMAAMAESEDMYPCLLVMCGSGFGMTKVFEFIFKAFRLLYNDQLAQLFIYSFRFQALSSL